MERRYTNGWSFLGQFSIGQETQTGVEVSIQGGSSFFFLEGI